MGEAEWISGGTFWMGSNNFYPEERPEHQVHVDGFWMDRHPVTVEQFQRFVVDTGYRTTAESAPSSSDYPDVDPSWLVPGSLVFTQPAGPVPLDDFRQWWSWTPGADWCHPEGPTSSVADRAAHPVTQVSYRDALSYAEWAGKDLPTEAEWEFAARGGLDRSDFVWGAEHLPEGRPPANTWLGSFPWERLGDEPIGTTPVGSYAANGFGLFDMAGNVWEWTHDRYTADHRRSHNDSASSGSCCTPSNPRVLDLDNTNQVGLPRRVIKGGSYLCAPNYCLRYRPAARQGETEDSATCHIGFRCVRR